MFWILLLQKHGLLPLLRTSFSGLHLEHRSLRTWLILSFMIPLLLEGDLMLHSAILAVPRSQQVLLVAIQKLIDCYLLVGLILSPRLIQVVQRASSMIILGLMPPLLVFISTNLSLLDIHLFFRQYI